jgi:hypothetical protein
MPDTTIAPLKQVNLTAAVNEMRLNGNFLTRLLYSRVETLHTEDIELSVYSRGRKRAPFVKKNGEGVMVSGHNETFQMVQAPNIRIKRPFTPSELLFPRRAGMPVFTNPQEQAAAIQAHINRDLAGMESDIVGAEEWLVAQSLTGQIQYQVADGDVFQITFPRANTHNIALGGSAAWDAYSASGGVDPAVNPLQDVHNVKRILSNSTGVTATDMICGKNAIDALQQMAENDGLPALKTDAGISAGQLSFVEQFSDQGAMFHGMLGGLRVWEYVRDVEFGGSTTSFIRDDYVEFVTANSQAADRVMYYGAIADMDAINQGTYIGRRFAKSWMLQDPSSMMALVASRPLPVPRRPDAQVSLKVCNI